MILYPAIDILDGHAVRLTKGDFDTSKVYDQDPLAAARRWVDEGADHLHMVDLDGARAGAPVNLEHVRRVVRELGVSVQLGGGLRTSQAIAEALAAGVERVILGTVAFADPALLERSLAEHGPERVMVSVDVRRSEVMTEGWTRAADAEVRRVFAELIGRGVRELIYTNIDRDGMLGGMNRDDVVWVAKAVGGEGQLIYSGGIGELNDLEVLAELGEEALTGVIVGKALYEGRFTIAQAQAALRI